MQEHHSARPHFTGLFATVAVVSLSLSLMIPTFALANPSSNEKQAEAQAALASLNSMQDKLNDASISYDAASEAQDEAEAKCEEAQARISEANDQIAGLQDRLSVRARSMYRTGSTTMLDLLFGSTTFQAFASNWDILNQINQDDADLVQQTKDLRAEVQEQESIYAEEQSVAIQKAADAKRVQGEVASTIAAMQATYDGLSAEATELLEQERAAQQAADAAAAPAVVESSIQQAAGSSGSGSANTGGGSYRPDPTPAPSYDSGVGGSVVSRAYSQIGKGYGYDDPSYGAGPNQYDCSGFVAFCLSGSYSRMGSTLTFMNWPIASDPQPGDVAVSASHCGIYIGGNMMVHAATFGVGVITGPVQPGMIIVRPS